jgi:large subunit ribosomal protein L21
MYAVLELHSKQFIIKEGDDILIDIKKGIKEKDKLIFNSILAIVTENENVFGQPYVKCAEVHTVVVSPIVKGKKIHVFKKKRRKGYQRKNGHRQWYTEIEFQKITASPSKKTKTSSKKEVPAATDSAQEEE